LGLPRERRECFDLTPANRIHDALLQPMQISGLQLQVGCSIGAAIYPQEADSAEALLQLADKRMYAVKQAAHKWQAEREQQPEETDA